MESSKGAVSGVRRRKRKGPKRQSKRQQLQSAEATLVPEPETKGDGNENPFLESLKSGFGLFKTTTTTTSDQSQEIVDQKLPATSTGSSEPSATSNPPIAAEVQQQLNRVPDVIGDEGGELGGTDEPEIGSGEISALLDSIAFEEQDVKDTLEELFAWLDEYFGTDHWKLTPRQVRMLGRPTAQLLNSIWAKLKTRIPDILAAWCESTPGATAFLMAFGIVVVPKGLKQWKLSRSKEERKLQPAHRDPSDMPSVIPAPAASGRKQPDSVPYIPNTAIPVAQAGMMIGGQ